MKEILLTTYDELVELIKSGDIFGFCIAFALNKGYRDAMTKKEQVAFKVGSYEVSFDHKKMCFCLSHDTYIFRVMIANFHGTTFIGAEDDSEVINQLLTELEKEQYQWSKLPKP